MPSHIPSLFFTVEIDGKWQLTEDRLSSYRDPATFARHHLRREVARVLAGHSVLHVAAAQDAVNTAIGQPMRPISGIEVTGSAHLTVMPEDRKLAEDLLRRQRALDLEHEEEMYRLAHLQRVLADSDLRCIWWLARFPDRLGEVAQLESALKDLPLPHVRDSDEDGIRSDVRRFTDQFLEAMHTPQQREVFLKALTQTLHVLGHRELKTAAAQWQNPHEPGSTPA